MILPDIINELNKSYPEDVTKVTGEGCVVIGNSRSLVSFTGNFSSRFNFQVDWLVQDDTAPKSSGSVQFRDGVGCVTFKGKSICTGSDPEMAIAGSAGLSLFTTAIAYYIRERKWELLFPTREITRFIKGTNETIGGFTDMGEVITIELRNGRICKYTNEESGNEYIKKISSALGAGLDELPPFLSEIGSELISDTMTLISRNEYERPLKSVSVLEISA